jgi:Fe-S-cluster containining protein
LDGSHRCSIYEHRPAICRQLDANGCEHHGRPAIREIRTPRQLEAYLEELAAKRSGRSKK